jgi:ubiquinone/menaquinone biosynthesis C-methylase UbiE
MQEKKKQSFCPLFMAGILDSKLRRFLFNPNKILKPYINKNMTALDIGCGPGVYTIEIAKLLEGTGKVVAVDLQEGMLEIIKKKIIGKSYESNIILHKCLQDKININGNYDFALMFYVVHEVPSKANLFNEILPLINKNGLLMIVEPKLISSKDFNEMINVIKENGFEEYNRLKITLSRGIVLKKM